MFKQEISYEDFNGNQATDTLYFNLTKSELIELEAGKDGSWSEHLNRIVASTDKNGLIQEFKAIVLKAYGVKSEDGKRFIKSDQIREEFSQTAAYDALFMKLATEDEYAAKFMMGLMPKDMAVEIEKAMKTSDSAIDNTLAKQVTEQLAAKAAEPTELSLPDQPS
jgi:hypothetical protein